MLFVLFLSFQQISAQDSIGTKLPINLDAFGDGIHHWFLEVRDLNYERCDSADYIGIADNLLAYQNRDGGWPKNIDWLGKLKADSVKATLSEHYRQSTFDNRNVYPQIEYLAHARKLSGYKKYSDGALRGLDYIFRTQYPNGGWRGWDVDAITYNDDVMTGIMNLLLDIVQKQVHYDWLPNSYRKKAAQALTRALDLTLRCQVTVNGKKTAWAQQHDHQTLLPVKARTFELPGLSANESSTVLLFLMRIEKPDKRVVEAVEAGVAWLRESAIYGVKVETVDVPEGTYPGLTIKIDRREVPDSSAGPIWARFYEVETNRPFMCTRQGAKVYSLNDVNPERRAGYAWYGSWPKAVLAGRYDEWKRTNRVK